MAHLVLSSVNKVFQRQQDRVHVLNDINLTIEKGEIVAIIGTNGAGKSTLLNALTGQVTIDSGTITLAGHPISQWNPVKIAGLIGHVFQDPSLGTAPRMTVFENLMLAARRDQKRGLKKSLTPKNYEEMAEYVAQFQLDLEKRLDLPIENLSGGQRQIISLVMATMNKPDLLLLDEHTAALDPRTAKQVMQMSQEMVRQHQLTTLMITHHLQDAIDYSDRIIVMHQGTIQRHYSKDEMSQLSSGELYEYLESLIY